ncbi:MAG: hypothetical protein IJC91_03355, partial [Oscillospiraceae bacterium]|nr:hypothetical protein [Oscillospiraceae bacterium]
KLEWKYTKNEEELKVECGARGEDLPIDLVIKCHVDMQLFQLFSHLPFNIPEDKRIDFAIVTAYVNNKMVDGCFDYNVMDGSLFFRMTNSFNGGKLGFETIKYLIFCACATIDAYNDKFLMVAKGILSLEKFLSDEV